MFPVKLNKKQIFKILNVFQHKYRQCSLDKMTNKKYCMNDNIKFIDILKHRY